jgi:prepilin-type N-terminal cleavage/methylation domain-containing protein
MPSAHLTRHPSRQGFSLIELLVVLVVSGVIMSIVAPRLEPGRWRADAAVQEVVVSLNAAQRLAMLRQHDIVVTFQTNERRLRLLQDRNNNGDADAGEDVRVVQLPETMGFGRGSAPQFGTGSAAVTFRIKDGAPTLIFHRNGSASESGQAYLKPLEGSMSFDAEAVRAVSVERSTGVVRCFSYRTAAWEGAC